MARTAGTGQETLFQQSRNRRATIHFFSDRLGLDAFEVTVDIADPSLRA